MGYCSLIWERPIAENLQIDTKQNSIYFLSRVGKDRWLQPYESDTLQKLASEGKKKGLYPSSIQKCSWVKGCADGPIELINLRGNVMKFTYGDKKIKGHITITYPSGSTITIKDKLYTLIDFEGARQNFKLKLT